VKPFFQGNRNFRDGYLDRGKRSKDWEGTRCQEIKGLAIKRRALSENALTGNSVREKAESGGGGLGGSGQKRPSRTRFNQETLANRKDYLESTGEIKEEAVRPLEVIRVQGCLACAG